MEALAAVGSADGGSKLAGGDGKRIRHSNPGGIIAEITVGEIIENLSLRCYGGQRQPDKQYPFSKVVHGMNWAPNLSKCPAHANQKQNFRALLQWEAG